MLVIVFIKLVYDYFYKYNDSFRFATDEFYLSLPVVGDLIRLKEETNFVENLHILLDSGFNIQQA